jgi:predicted O-methyltransferase YrrM
MIVTPEVDEYLSALPPAAEGVLAEMESYGRERSFPLVGPVVGRLLRLLAQTAGAKRVFECGSGYGYSAMWFAEAVGRDGEVFLTDNSPENVEKSREFLGRAGYEGRCHFLRGDAIALLEDSYGTFDIVFVDIDKEGYPDSLAVTVPKLRPGGLLITDNVLWKGRVVEEAPDDESTRAIRAYNEKLYDHPDLETVIVPLRDGVSVSRKHPR